MDDRRATPDEEPSEAGSGEHASLFHLAWKEGVEVAGSARPLFRLMWQSLVDGLLMATRVVPSILAIGMLGLLLAKYTPVFDLLGYLLYPFAWLSQVDSPGLVSTALASGLAEMFLPAIQTTDLTDSARFTVGIVSVSSILFFSASIPCILATEIPISIWQMVCIWFQRTALSIPLAAGLAHLIL
jgi:nucleoside recognition membrane protein YjiH